ncbi:integral membrane protein GPR137B-like isoform X2 [Acanthaster planci]|uniref:Integral membrane protein GPR137B-like isoform X2 n=1 Tax=Acanthaster planci TaxID=133434 RepID=A0A8B7ZSJ9_ACAPL|nr:integral membrane protein GPR137B-like isoform X2 [Acanthaster planci]
MEEIDHVSWTSLGKAVAPSPIGTAFPMTVELGLTISFITLYGFIFGLVYIQLILILYYGHKRLSFQTVFLFLCLIWAGVRVTLFTFYINNTIQVDDLQIFGYWFFFCFPVCLQFITLCLLVLYFAQVLFKLKARTKPENYKRHIRHVRITFVVMVTIFLVMNITCAVLTRLYSNSPVLVPIRVSISGLLFILAGVVLAYLIWKLSRMQFVGSMLLEARGATLFQTSTACVFIILLYVSRAVYNIIAITRTCPSFGYNWINVSDQADMINTLKGLRYLSFGIILFIWEFLPTFIVVMFFRVRKFAANVHVPKDPDCPKTPSRAYFFDNPRRYDSDDDLTRTHSSTNATPRDYQGENMSIPSTPINGTPHVGYGTIVRSSSYPTGYGVPGMTPPMLFAGIPGNISIRGYHENEAPE